MAAAVNGEEKRTVQKSYWIELSKDLTVEAMMLDSRASDLDKEERPELYVFAGTGICFPSFGPLSTSYKGKSVLELGAGIGRFTGELAKETGHVLALDFIGSVIKKNENVHGHFKNMKFMCADVTSPDLIIEAESVDLIFSNWLRMYLSENEITFPDHEAKVTELATMNIFSQPMLEKIIDTGGVITVAAKRSGYSNQTDVQHEEEMLKAKSNCESQNHYP